LTGIPDVTQKSEEKIPSYTAPKAFGVGIHEASLQLAFILSQVESLK